MKYDTFWQIIDEASAKSNGEIGLKKEILEKKINKLECSDVADFVFWNWRYQGALCSPPMLAAICLLLNEELTDNSFPEFQNAIIGQGKEFYLKALGDPEALENTGTFCWDHLSHIQSLRTSITKDAEVEIPG